MTTVGRLLRTARHLDPRQIGWRAVREAELYAYRRWPRASEGLWSWLLEDSEDAVSAGVRVRAPAPELLGRERLVAERWAGGEVAYLGITGQRDDWLGRGRSRLWVYERHYHSELVALAATAAATRDVAWTEQARGLIRSWLASNPAPCGAGWEPYPVARRVLSWSLAAALVPELAQMVARPLALHLRFLRAHIEWHLLGNHLLCDAAALTAGAAMLESDTAARTGAFAEALLARELESQVLADGGYAERTVQYHAIVLRDTLLAIGLRRAHALPTLRLERAARPLARWLYAIQREGFEPPWWNDAAPDTCPPLDEVLSLAAALGVGDAHARTWIGDAFGGHRVKRRDADSDVSFPHTGWTFVREGEHELRFDHGPLGPDEQPGHGHSDALAYELVWSGCPVVTDSGVTTYDAGPIRDFERSARAHATVTVDGEGPDELWASFRVGARARVSGGVQGRTAEGVRVLSGQVVAWQGWTHRRRIAFWPGEALLVCDDVDRGGDVVSRVPFDPACALVGDSLRTRSGELSFSVLRGRLGHPVCGQESPREGWVGAGFGRALPRQSIPIHADERGSVAYVVSSPGRQVILAGDVCTIRGPRGVATVRLPAAT